MNNTPLQVLMDLGGLHRASIWENIALNVGLSSKGIEAEPVAGSTPLGESPSQTTTDLPGTEIPVSANGQNSANGALLQDNTVNTQGGAVKDDAPRDWNAAALRHLTQGLPNALAPFFQGLLIHATPHTYALFT